MFPFGTQPSALPCSISPRFLFWAEASTDPLPKRILSRPHTIQLRIQNMVQNPYSHRSDHHTG
jgi:hypothetical protein